MKATDEQKAKLAEVMKEMGTLRKEFLDKVTPLLTDEQKAKLKERGERRGGQPKVQLKDLRVLDSLSRGGMETIEGRPCEKGPALFCCALCECRIADLRRYCFSEKERREPLVPVFIGVLIGTLRSGGGGIPGEAPDLATISRPVTIAYCTPQKAAAIKAATDQ